MNNIIISRRLRLPKAVVVMIASALVFVAVVTVVAVLFVNRDQVELSSGGFKINKSEYDALIVEAKEYGVGEVDARDNLLHSLRVQDAAKSIGVEPDKYQAAAAVLALGVAGQEVDSKSESYAQRAQYSKAVNEYVKFYEEGGYRYLALRFPFSRYVYGPDMPGMDKDIYSNPRSVLKISDDMAYAKSKAGTYRDKLVKGEITPEAAIRDVTSDARLVYGGAGNDSTIHTVGFDGKRVLSGVVMETEKDELSIVKAMKVGEISAVVDQIASRYNDVDISVIATGDDRMKTGYSVYRLLDKNSPRANAISDYYKKVKELER